MSSPVAYTHYVFDLDGTLVDSIPGIDSAARSALAELSPDEQLPSLRTFIGPPIRVMLQRALRWTDDTRLDALERNFRSHYDGGAWKKTAAYEGVDNTLRQLHSQGARLHVLTNKPPAPTSRILDHLGWTPLFTAIVSPQSRTPPFPDKAAAALDLRDRLGLPPATTLLVGDSPDDAAAAHAADFGFSAAVWGYGDAAHNHPARALASFSDIVQLSSLHHA